MRFWLSIVLVFQSIIYGYSQDGFIAGLPRLAYWQVGSHKQTVIVLHGGAGVPHQYLRPEFDALSQVAKVIYYDQRGCGKSDTTDSYTWQEHVADLKRLIGSFRQRSKVILIGSSWGSHLALLYAYTYPKEVKGLILSGTYQWAGEAKPYHRQVRYPHYSPHKQAMDETRIVISVEADGRKKQDTLAISKRIDVYSGAPMTETRESLLSAPVADCLKQISVPILLFNGSFNQERDWVSHYKKLLPNLEVCTIYGAGHDPWFSEPEQFFARCKQFINALQ